MHRCTNLIAPVERPPESALLRRVWLDQGKPAAQQFTPTVQLHWLLRHRPDNVQLHIPGRILPTGGRFSALIYNTGHVFLLDTGDRPLPADVDICPDDRPVRILTSMVRIPAMLDSSPDIRHYPAIAPTRTAGPGIKIEIPTLSPDGPNNLYRRIILRPNSERAAYEKKFVTRLKQDIDHLGPLLLARDMAHQASGIWPLTLSRLVFTNRHVPKQLRLLLQDLVDEIWRRSGVIGRIGLKVERPHVDGRLPQIDLQNLNFESGIARNLFRSQLHRMWPNGCLALQGPERPGTALAASSLPGIHATTSTHISMHRRLALSRRFSDPD